MQHRFVLGALITCLVRLSVAAQTGTQPSVVLEATNSIHGVGGHVSNRLLVRLTTDGKVEWESVEWQGPNQLHSSRIPPEMVSALTERLNEVDLGGLQPKMGPYNGYVDTSVELFVHVATAKWNRQFSVINPWSGRRAIQTVPRELKAVICEVDRLHVRVTGEQEEPMCVEKPPAPHS